MKYLHEDRLLFLDAIEEVAKEKLLPVGMVEKDYYITELLRELSSMFPFLVFKGGTSLSKCYGAIERFSEDIDLSTDIAITQGQRRQIKEKLFNTVSQLGMAIVNAEDIKSRQNYNRYVIAYDSVLSPSALSSTVIVEILYSITAVPVDELPVQSMIGFYLQKNNPLLAKDFLLSSFRMKNQSLARTFIDKVFALADYELRGERNRQSRHIYDLYKLSSHVSFDKNFSNLVRTIREQRQHVPLYLSAQENININKVLHKIVELMTFKEDYNTKTLLLLQEKISYSEAIKILDKIIKSKSFDF